MSWKVMGGAALGQGEGEEGPEPSASLAEAEPGGRGVMRLEGWKGQQRVAATPQRHVRRCGRCEGSPLEGVRQGSDGFSLLCLCPLRVRFMCLWLSPPCWELAEGRLSPLSFQELHEGRNHGPVPSDTSPSASGTVRLHWVAPPIRKCAPGAGMLSAWFRQAPKQGEENYASATNGQLSYPEMPPPPPAPESPAALHRCGLPQVHTPTYQAGLPGAGGGSGKAGPCPPC